MLHNSFIDIYLIVFLFFLFFLHGYMTKTLSIVIFSAKISIESKFSMNKITLITLRRFCTEMDVQQTQSQHALFVSGGRVRYVSAIN